MPYDIVYLRVCFQHLVRLLVAMAFPEISPKWNFRKVVVPVCLCVGTCDVHGISPRVAVPLIVGKLYPFSVLQRLCFGRSLQEAQRTVSQVARSNATGRLVKENLCLCKRLLPHALYREPI